MIPAILNMLNRFKRPLLGATGMPVLENAFEQLYHNMNTTKDNHQHLLQDESPSFLTYKRHAMMVVEQAFKDMKFKGKVKVQFTRDLRSGTDVGGFCDVSISNYRSLDEGHVAVVELFYTDPSQLQRFTLKQIYAMAGHNAAHVTHNHSVIDGARRGFVLGEALTNFRFVKLPIVFFANYAISLCMSKLMVFDADISSTLKLNTSADLISYLSVFKAKHLERLNKAYYNALTEEQRKAAPNQEQFVECLDIVIDAWNIFDSHPSLENRISAINYFKRMYGQNSSLSLLFKSPAYQQILSERQAAAIEGPKVMQ
jgi:hypothetical protein